MGPLRKNCFAHNHAVQAITSVKFWPNLEAKTWKIGQNTISWFSRKSLFFKIVFIGEYKLWQRSDIVAVEETWCKDDQRSENNQAGMEEPADCANESRIGYTGCVIRRSSTSCWFGFTSVSTGEENDGVELVRWGGEGSWLNWTRLYAGRIGLGTSAVSDAFDFSPPPVLLGQLEQIGGLSGDHSGGREKIWRLRSSKVAKFSAC